MEDDMYGKELIIDLHNCDPSGFNRKDIEEYFSELCLRIDMQRCEFYFWDDVGVQEEEKQTSPHTKGTSAVQFILTSNITIHTLDILKKIFINVFSCKDFDVKLVEDFTIEFFGGEIVKSTTVVRL